MRVLGKTRNAEAHRLALDLDGRAVVALIPDALLSAEHRMEAKVPHGAAYEWIETHADALKQAAALRAAGRRPRAPFDQITLDAAP